MTSPGDPPPLMASNTAPGPRAVWAVGAVLALVGIVAIGAFAVYRLGDRESYDHAVRVRVGVAPATPEHLAATERVVRGRLDALGVKVGDVATTGDTVSFSVGRQVTPDEARGLGSFGYLAFRPVLRTVQPAAAIPGFPGADCGNAEERRRLGTTYGGRMAEKVVACDVDGNAKYLLGPAEMNHRDVRTAFASGGSGGGVVRVQFVTPARFAALTGKYTGRQLAIVVDGVVQSAPTIQERISDGGAQISGSYTAEGARLLAAVLRLGPLPVPVEVTAT